MVDNEGSVTTEIKDHILFVGLNRPEKYNGYTPIMANQLVDALTLLDENDELRVGVLFGHGDNFTAGLDLPKWTQRMSENNRSHTNASDRVDPMALGRACKTYNHSRSRNHIYFRNRTRSRRRHHYRSRQLSILAIRTSTRNPCNWWGNYSVC